MKILIDNIQKGLEESTPVAQTLIETLMPLLKLTMMSNYELQSVKFETMAKWSKLLKDSGLDGDSIKEIIIENMRLSDRMGTTLLAFLGQATDKILPFITSQEFSDTLESLVPNSTEVH